MITVYIDGSCDLSTGHGGWAWWVHGDLWAAGAVEPATNNQMELLAVIQALRSPLIDPHVPVKVVSDSTYVVNCLNRRWYARWRQDGWLTKQGNPRANWEYWEELVGIIESRPAQLVFHHCRGHGRGGIEDAPYVHGNSRADYYAGEARRSLKRHRIT